MLAEKIARRYLRDTVMSDNLFGLRALPGPRGTEKNHGANLALLRGLIGRFFGHVVGHRNGPFYSYFPSRKIPPGSALAKSVPNSQFSVLIPTLLTEN
jgi:hypothetical protein